jgi:hypothetical protein
MVVDKKSNRLGVLRPGGKDGFVFMMHTHSWGSWVYEIKETKIDGTLQFGEGGFQEARGTGNPQTGGGSFYISHRPEFLDSAGEWYLDEASDTLFLAVAAGENPPVEVFAPIVDEIFSIQGSQANPVTDVRVSSLTIRHTAPTYMGAYTVPSGGDYSVHRGAAIHLNGTASCTIDHNLFDGIGGNGIWLTDFNRGALVSANEMRHIGENGVGMTGSTEWVDGRNGNQPRHNTIEGNLIHHLGLYTKQSCAIFSGVR